MSADPVGVAVRAAAERLAAASDTARLDAELLMAHALGLTRERLLLGAAEGRAVPDAYEALVARRQAHEPIAYITGTRDFWTITLGVSPAVLIPRPESETLIEAAIDHFDARSPAHILDLGTGSGALLLASLAEWPEAEGVGVDISAAALMVAQDNAARLGLSTRARFEHGGWRGDPAADLVLCNPPYIATGEALPADVVDHEPASALFAGMDGLDEYRRIAAVLAFAPGGCACIEIGATQAEAVSALFAARGFVIEIRADLAGRDRCLRITAS